MRHNKGNAFALLLFLSLLLAVFPSVLAAPPNCIANCVADQYCATADNCGSTFKCANGVCTTTMPGEILPGYQCIAGVDCQYGASCLPETLMSVGYVQSDCNDYSGVPTPGGAYGYDDPPNCGHCTPGGGYYLNNDNGGSCDPILSYNVQVCQCIGSSNMDGDPTGEACTPGNPLQCCYPDTFFCTAAPSTGINTCQNCIATGSITECDNAHTCCTGNCMWNTALGQNTCQICVSGAGACNPGECCNGNGCDVEYNLGTGAAIPGTGNCASCTEKGGSCTSTSQCCGGYGQLFCNPSSQECEICAQSGESCASNPCCGNAFCNGATVCQDCLEQCNPSLPNSCCTGQGCTDDPAYTSNPTYPGFHCMGCIPLGSSTTCPSALPSCNENATSCSSSHYCIPNDLGGCTSQADCCDSGATCDEGVCKVCGGDGQPCCSGNSCTGSLACDSGGTCTQCTANEASGCTQDSDCCDASDRCNPDGVCKQCVATGLFGCPDSPCCTGNCNGGICEAGGTGGCEGLNEPCTQRIDCCYNPLTTTPDYGTNCEVLLNGSRECCQDDGYALAASFITWPERICCSNVSHFISTTRYCGPPGSTPSCTALNGYCPILGKHCCGLADCGILQDGGSGCCLKDGMGQCGSDSDCCNGLVCNLGLSECEAPPPPTCVQTGDSGCPASPCCNPLDACNAGVCECNIPVGAPCTSNTPGLVPDTCVQKSSASPVCAGADCGARGDALSCAAPVTTTSSCGWQESSSDHSYFCSDLAGCIGNHESYFTSSTCTGNDCNWVQSAFFCPNPSACTATNWLSCIQQGCTWDGSACGSTTCPATTDQGTCEGYSCCKFTTQTIPPADCCEWQPAHFEGGCCPGFRCNGNCVPNSAPYQPAAPVLTNDTANTAKCVQNCPPTSGDPNNDPVNYTYKWIVNGVDPDWIDFSVPPIYDCTGCTWPTTIQIQTQACDDSLCSTSLWSNPITFGTPPPPLTWGGGTNTYMIYAFIIAIAILVLAYMTTYVFNLPQIRPIIIDEVWQLVITVAIALCLIGIVLFIDGYLSGMLGTATGTTAPTMTMMDAAQSTLTGLSGQADTLITALSDQSTNIGREASKGIFCNFLGVGFSLVNCSPLNAFRGSLTLAAFATTAAIADTYAQMFLLSLAQSYAFTFIIPLGLLLRCFKLSRGAGGALIAIGFGFYAVYPTVVVATDRMLHDTNLYPSPPAYVLPQLTGGPSDAENTCDPRETDVTKSLAQFDAYANDLTDFGNSEKLTYFVLVKILFMSILNLIITLGFIRMFAHIIGSEIDVSGLARIS